MPDCFVFEGSLPLRVSVFRLLRIWKMLMYGVDGIWVGTLIGKGVCSVIFEPGPVRKNILCVSSEFSFRPLVCIFLGKC